jgi:hypothetical protein
LSLDRILRCAIESLDAQVLLDPFEEEFHLPAAFVELGNAQGWQGEVVGQKDQTLLLFGIEETYPAQFVGKILGSIVPPNGFSLCPSYTEGVWYLS